jgi:hypothetical protein
MGYILPPKKALSTRNDFLNRTAVAKEIRERIDK